MDVLSAVEPLNHFLCGLHGPTDDLAKTMSSLVPFPRSIGSLPDADLLDLNLDVEIDAPATAGRESDRGVVDVQVRYATRARLNAVHRFYRNEFAASDAYTRPTTNEGDRVHISAVLRDARRTRYVVTVDDFRAYRAVKVRLHYGDFDHREIFRRFACWHNGTAPVHPHRPPSGIEISTFASGRRPHTLVLYSTRYACSSTSRTSQRRVVDQRIAELGWTYREPREGIMFIKDSEFDAETHVEGDDHHSSVTFVGEFQLR